MPDDNKKKIFTKSNIMIFFIVISIILASVALFFSLQKTSHSNQLYSTNLNEATFIPSPEMKLLYSYSLNSGAESSSGFFTVVVDGNFQVPNIKYEVRDQTDKIITQGRTIVGKTTNINFKGTENTKTVNLYIKTASTSINLKNLTITLDNSFKYTI